MRSVTVSSEIFLESLDERTPGEGAAFDDLPDSAVYLIEHRRVVGFKVKKRYFHFIFSAAIRTSRPSFTDGAIRW